MNALPLSRVAPYRPLFLLGTVEGWLGTGVWPLYAAGAAAYPGVTHRLLMMQGFEQCFVLGFLLTAIQGFTKGKPCRPQELFVALAAALTFGIAALLGAWRVAVGAFLASLLLLLVAIASRLGPSTTKRPPELMFVGFGLLLGAMGGVWQLVGGVENPLPGRLVSLGMVLSLVLGLGSLLVPTFSAMAAPVSVPGMTGPPARGNRAPLYVILLGALAASFVLEARGRVIAAAWLRAGVATVMLLGVWKLMRVPRRRDAPAFALWTSGWLILTGLWLAALVPSFTLGALHLVFIGGFALLTLGIATRVTVAHGRYPLTEEPRVLSPGILSVLGLTILVRLGAEWLPAHAVLLMALSGTFWIATWALWAWNAFPKLLGGAGPTT
ncbi:MAG TPA: NnrS family protein [Candidatus Eisenbacteria bacterium]|jgi:uncharacterized protein involved in response to NO|nr:NnrS family protein [Candidatus Eisenbacteria bacterium]